MYGHDKHLGATTFVAPYLMQPPWLSLWNDMFCDDTGEFPSDPGETLRENT